MAARHKSVETKYYEDRERALRALRACDRRTFLKLSAAAIGAVMAKGLASPHTFQLVEVANAAVDKSWGRAGTQGSTPFPFAYISDVHLFFFFNDTATTEIYTLSLHDALPISRSWQARMRRRI